MRSCFVLLFASLLTSCEAQGTIETPVFVLKGRDLLLKLHADPPEGLLAVDWKINKTVNLVRFDPSGKTTVSGKFELGRKIFSVILKNLQEADSGVYSAVAVTSTPTGDQLVSEYKVTVQGPVTPVELTVDRVDSSSSESCDLHVTCRTHNSHINSTFRCVDRVCSQGGGEQSEVTTSGASLQVYLLNSTIICNHSNKVHRTQDLIHAEHLCPSIPDPPLHYGWIIAICFAAVYCGFCTLFLFIWCYHKRRTIYVGRRSEDLVHEVLLDENVTNISEEPGTHQSNIKKKTSELRLMLSPPNASELGRFEDFVRSVHLAEHERQWLYKLNMKAASGEKMEELDLQLLDLLTQKAASEEKTSRSRSTDDVSGVLEREFEDLVCEVLRAEHERQWLDRLNKKAASRKKMEERERLLLDLLKKKAALWKKMTEPKAEKDQHLLQLCET